MLLYCSTFHLQNSATVILNCNPLIVVLLYSYTIKILHRPSLLLCKQTLILLLYYISLSTTD